MHKSSYLRMEHLIRHYEPYFTQNKESIKVLDIGSYDVNGTYRQILTNPRYEYTGMDMAAGPNVDIVPKDIYHWDEIADETYDLVLSGQVFEHIEYPWLTIREIARVLKPSGLCILIAPSSGMEHKAPKDCYRYYADGFAALASWADLKVWHTSVGGVPKTEQLDDWLDDWNDGCLVAQKMPFWIETIEEPLAQEKRFPVYGFRDVYKLWEAAVMRAVQKFETKKPAVLFGAGLIGSIVLEIMGAENVQYFVDHSSTKIGREYRGKQIVSAEDYLKESSKYNCLITASYAASVEIRQELECAGAQCAILYDL